MAEEKVTEEAKTDPVTGKKVVTKKTTKTAPDKTLPVLNTIRTNTKTTVAGVTKTNASLKKLEKSIPALSQPLKTLVKLFDPKSLKKILIPEVKLEPQQLMVINNGSKRSQKETRDFYTEIIGTFAEMKTFFIEQSKHEKIRDERDERRDKENKQKKDKKDAKNKSQGFFSNILNPAAFGKMQKLTEGAISSFFMYLMAPKLLGALITAKVASSLLPLVSRALVNPLTIALGGLAYSVYSAVGDSAAIAASTNNSAISAGITAFVMGDNAKKDLMSTLTNAGKWAAMGAGAGMIGGPVGMIAGAIIGGAIGAAAHWFGDTNAFADRIELWSSKLANMYDLIFISDENDARVKQQALADSINTLSDFIDGRNQELIQSNADITSIETELAAARATGNTQVISALENRLLEANALNEAIRADIAREQEKLQEQRDSFAIFSQDSHIGRMYEFMGQSVNQFFQDMNLLWTDNTGNEIYVTDLYNKAKKSFSDYMTKIIDETFTGMGISENNQSFSGVVDNLSTRFWDKASFELDRFVSDMDLLWKDSEGNEIRVSDYINFDRITDKLSQWSTSIVDGIISIFNTVENAFNKTLDGVHTILGYVGIGPKANVDPWDDENVASYPRAPQHIIDRTADTSIPVGDGLIPMIGSDTINHDSRESVSHNQNNTTENINTTYSTNNETLNRIFDFSEDLSTNQRTQENLITNSNIYEPINQKISSFVTMSQQQTAERENKESVATGGPGFIHAPVTTIDNRTNSSSTTNYNAPLSTRDSTFSTHTRGGY